MQGRNGALISNNFAGCTACQRGIVYSRLADRPPRVRRRGSTCRLHGGHRFHPGGSGRIPASVGGRPGRHVRSHAGERIRSGSRSDGTFTPAFRDSRNVFVLTNADMRDEILRLTDQFFSLQYVQLFISILVALLGIVIR